MFNYNPFWKTMEAKNITQYKLIKDYSFSTGTLDALRKGESITMHTLDRLCQILDCTPNDIVEIIKD